MRNVPLYQERNLARCQVYLELPRPQVERLNHPAPACWSVFRLAAGADRSPVPPAVPSRGHLRPHSFVLSCVHPSGHCLAPPADCSPRSSRSLPGSGSRSEPYELEAWLAVSRVMTVGATSRLCRPAVLGDVLPTISAPGYALTDDGSRAGGGPRSCRCSCSRFRPKLAAQLSHTTTDRTAMWQGRYLPIDDTEGDYRPWFRPAARDCHLVVRLPAPSLSSTPPTPSHPPHCASTSQPTHPRFSRSLCTVAGFVFLFIIAHFPRRAAIARPSTLSSSLLPLGFFSSAIAPPSPPLTSSRCARQKDVDLAGFKGPLPGLGGFWHGPRRARRPNTESAGPNITTPEGRVTARAIRGHEAF